MHVLKAVASINLNYKAAGLFKYVSRLSGDLRINSKDSRAKVITLL